MNYIQIQLQHRGLISIFNDPKCQVVPTVMDRTYFIYEIIMRVELDPMNQLQSSAAALSRCTSSPAALVQHVQIKLALADVASVVVDAVLEGLRMDVA